ncbi:MAG: hypothetical protein Q8L81_02390 [Bacteroidota bacterium]|nr:hypothetical protein [Bacteroidota bacterium]
MTKIISKFYFLANINGKNYPFREALGLELTSTIKPLGNIVLKKGLIDTNNSVWSDVESELNNITKAITIFIKLTDDLGTPIRTWTLRSANIVAVKSPQTRLKCKDVPLEAIEFSFSEMSVKKN